MKPIKNVAVIQDLSGFGRCSLSVIIPILSVMGIQPVPIPTAVLSTHTGGFGDVAMLDLSNFVEDAFQHYQSCDINFDCIFTGFLGSLGQIEHCKNYINHYRDALVVVDPVMGDNGNRYRTYTPEMCDAVGELVKCADIITPNKTEMYLLLNQPYDPSPITAQTAKSMLLKLSELGPKQVIVTGLQLADMSINNIAYDSLTNSFWRVKCEYVPVSYPGTGDIFASIVVASLLNNESLALAIEKASRFLELTIKTTYSYNTPTKHGVMLEKTLSWLTESHHLSGYQIL